MTLTGLFPDREKRSSHLQKRRQVGMFVMFNRRMRQKQVLNGFDFGVEFDHGLIDQNITHVYASVWPKS